MIEQILSEAETLLPESHVAILAREVRRLRAIASSDSVPVAWIVGGIGGDHFTDFETAKTIAATYGKEPTPLYLHPPKQGGAPPKATSCTGCIGASFDGRFQCAGCTDFSKYEQPSGAVVDANYLSDLEEAIIDASKELKGGKVFCENCGESVKTNEVDALLCLDPMLPRIEKAFALRAHPGEVKR